MNEHRKELRKTLTSLIHLYYREKGLDVLITEALYNIYIYDVFQPKMSCSLSFSGM